MTNRYPLIVNTSTNQIQELSASDNLDLTSSSIINAVSIGATNINVTGVVTASSFVGSFTGTITGTASTASFATTSFGLAGSPKITVGTIGATSLNASGVVTATSFVGNLTGTASTATAAATAYGLTGSPNITVNNVVAAAGTFTNLTVNGTQTIINTTSLEITDKNIGIGSTSTPSDSYADGAGITIYGTTNKTLTWDNSNSRLAFSTNVYAPKYYGDGSTLTNVSAGLALQQSGSAVVGGAATTINFSGATISNVSSGIATITIASAGLGTEALISSGIVTTLNLTKQDHKVTATGITTITVSGGTEGESHTVRIVNSGIATVGFSTFFLFPSGSVPSLPTTSGAISILSFTVHRVGAAGTQLLAGASQNFS